MTSGRNRKPDNRGKMSVYDAQLHALESTRHCMNHGVQTIFLSRPTLLPTSIQQSPHGISNLPIENDIVSSQRSITFANTLRLRCRSSYLTLCASGNLHLQAESRLQRYDQSSGHDQKRKPSSLTDPSHVDDFSRVNLLISYHPAAPLVFFPTSKITVSGCLETK